MVSKREREKGGNGAGNDQVVVGNVTTRGVRLTHTQTMVHNATSIADRVGHGQQPRTTGLPKLFIGLYAFYLLIKTLLNCHVKSSMSCT